MPRMLEFRCAGRRPVATEEELLAFANAIREAGGANALEALLPSDQREPSSCLIANALNFGCQVEPVTGLDGTRPEFPDGSWEWIMRLPANLTDEQMAALGKVKGVRLRKDKEGGYFLTLPKHIGNAADAFDYGAAFRFYRKDYDDEYDDDDYDA